MQSTADVAIGDDIEEPTADWWKVAISDIEEAAQARAPKELLAHRHACLDLLLRTASGVVRDFPGPVRGEFCKAFNRHLAYFREVWRPRCRTGDEHLMFPGLTAYAVASAFAQFVSTHYGALPDDDRSVAKKQRKRVSVAAQRLRREQALYPPRHPSGLKIAEAAKLLEEVAQEQRRPRGPRGFKEFRCWVALLAVAFEDRAYGTRRATVTYKDRGDGKENFGQFVEFVEEWVDHLAPQATTWWPATKSDRAYVIKDAINAKDAVQVRHFWWSFLRFELLEEAWWSGKGRRVLDSGVI